MIIILAIDIIDGKCVRLTKGNYDLKTIYSEDPLEVALKFEEAGIKRLHLVDLDGAKAGSVKNWNVLEKLAHKTKLAIDFSGGISSRQSVDIAFNSGASFIAVGSIAVQNEHLLSEWISVFGADKFIIGADVKDEKIMIKGWTEMTNTNVFDLIEKYKEKGIRQFFCTDINKDGLLQGPATSLYKKIIESHLSVKLIASGGVTHLNDLIELKETGCYGVIVGKAIYENRITLNDLKRFL